MKVYIEFLGWVREKTKRSWLWLEVPEHTSLRDLFKKHLSRAFGKEVVEALLDAYKRGALNVLVNGLAVELDYVLKGDDKVYLLPVALGGGI